MRTALVLRVTCVFMLALGTAASCRSFSGAAPAAGGVGGAAGDGELAAGAGGSSGSGGSQVTPQGGSVGGVPGGGASGANSGGTDVAGADTAGQSSGAAAGAGGEGGAAELPVAEGLQLWLRADKGVTLASGKVAKWEDQSGNQRDATQDLATSRPLLDAKAFGDQPGLAFDGGETSLILQPFDFDLSQGLTLFMLVQRNTSVTCEPFFTAQNGNDVDDIQLGAYQGAVNYEIVEDQLNDTKHPLSSGAPHFIAVVQASSGATNAMIDGQPAGSQQMLLPKTMKRTTVFVGHALYMTCPTLNGTIGEVLLYNRGLSAPEVDSVHAYLREHWACCGG